MIAVQGPNARAKVWQALPGSEPASSPLKPFTAATMDAPWGEVFIARTGYTGEDGFELMLPAATGGRASGARSLPQACARRGSARATRCGSKPA